MWSGPVRAGNRGGQGLFKWDEVKDDKHRENYLGHSINAPVGRWQRGKDLGWYAKDGQEGLAKPVNGGEVRDIKTLEAEAMAEALGLKVKRTGKSNVSQQEIQRLLKLDAAEYPNEDESAKTKGIGFGRYDTATFKAKPQYDSDESSNEGDLGKSSAEKSLQKRQLSDSDDDERVERKPEKKARKEKKHKKDKEKKQKKVKGSTRRKSHADSE